VRVCVSDVTGRGIHRGWHVVVVIAVDEEDIQLVEVWN
jgi:hypothetical protein